MLMMDKQTQRHRGFGFVSFDVEETVERICDIHFHEINGKMAEVKKAQPKEVMLSANIAKAALSGALQTPVNFYDNLITAATYPQQNLLTAAALRALPQPNQGFGLQSPTTNNYLPYSNLGGLNNNNLGLGGGLNGSLNGGLNGGLNAGINGGLSGNLNANLNNSMASLGGGANAGALGLTAGLLSPTGSNTSIDQLQDQRSLLAQYAAAQYGAAVQTSAAQSPLLTANALHNAAALMSMANALSRDTNNPMPQQQQQQGLSTSPLHQQRASVSPVPRALTAASPASNGYMSANSPQPNPMGSRPLIQANFTNIYHQGN
jgi:hypothetical protein